MSRTFELIRIALKLVQTVCGFGLLIGSFYLAQHGEYAHATYELILGAAFIYWGDKE